MAIHGDEVERYDSLAALSNATEDVVRGKVTAAEPGREIRDGNPSEGYETVQFLELTVQVGDNLGDAKRAVYGVEFGPHPPSELSGTWVTTLVGDEGIFVLRRKGSANPITGARQVDAELNLDKYRLVSSQGLLLNDSGAVAVPLAVDAGFPSDLDGADFESTANRVDTLNE